MKEGDNLGKAINDAMTAIEDQNDQLRGVLPRTYQQLSNSTLVSLLRSVNAIPANGSLGGGMVFGERCRLRTEGVASLREPTMVRARWRVPGATVCAGC